MSQTRTPFAVRRLAWIALLERLIALGDAAGAGEGLSRLDAQAIDGDMRRTGATAFPLPYVSAGAAAAGLRELARGFTAAELPDLKAALGRAVAEASRCCRQMIQIDDDNHAAAWRRRHPED